MAQRILAGDIGATKTNLALYTFSGHTRELVREATFRSQEHAHFETVLDAFLTTADHPLSAAGFGAAGPVTDDIILTTNLPWRLDTAQLSAMLNCPVRLLNDLEATAYGALFLDDTGLRTLNTGRPRAHHRAVIAAGTGLGQAILYWDGDRYHPIATEGGHVDFAPRSPREAQCRDFLHRTQERVSYEHLLSGPGLYAIFRFLTDELARPVSTDVQAQLQYAQDPSAIIGTAGVEGRCATCREAVEMFVDIYGAQAGNLALTVMATGGVYIGGGIATKILPLLTEGHFLNAFSDKAPFTSLLRDIPVHVILDPKTARHGAAHAAADILP